MIYILSYYLICVSESNINDLQWASWENEPLTKSNKWISEYVYEIIKPIKI